MLTSTNPIQARCARRHGGRLPPAKARLLVDGKEMAEVCEPAICAGHTGRPLIIRRRAGENRLGAEPFSNVVFGPPSKRAVSSDSKTLARAHAHDFAVAKFSRIACRCQSAMVPSRARPACSGSAGGGGGPELAIAAGAALRRGPRAGLNSALACRSQGIERDGPERLTDQRDCPAPPHVRPADTIAGSQSNCTNDAMRISTQCSGHALYLPAPSRGSRWPRRQDYASAAPDYDRAARISRYSWQLGHGRENHAYRNRLRFRMRPGIARRKSAPIYQRLCALNVVQLARCLRYYCKAW